MAKLRMFINYFERATSDSLPGNITIYRRNSHLEAENWRDDQTILTSLEVRPMYESLCVGATRGCILADFANRFIGGG